jgi:YVTN family beta-propeller protein
MPRALRFLPLGIAAFALAWLLPGQASDPPRKQPAGIRLRRPIALALADGGKTLLVANRDSGTVAVLDTGKLEVTAEVACGRKLSDLAATRSADLVLVTDEEAGEVVVLERRKGSLRELRRLPVGLSPVGVCLSADDRRAAVACLWPRRLAVLDLAAVAKAGKQARSPAPVLIDLPFAPRRLLPLPGGPRVLAADGFGGQLAVVNLASCKVESVRRLLAHNVRGLALDRGGKSVLLAHQVLHAQGRTVPGDVVSGNVIANQARKLSLADVLDPLADVGRDERLYQLGDIERGAGDPAQLAEAPDGQLLVALAGVNELAVGRPEQATWTRLAVGRRPTALTVDAAGRRAYLANTFGDSVSVVDLRVPKVVAEIRLGAAVPELRPEERGEVDFYDARLSHDAWYSCHSCHPDGHSNGRLNDNFTDGSFGTPKRVLTLRGTKDTGPWAWDGRLKDLESQVRTSLTSTMQGRAPSAGRVKDLAAFLRTLPPAPALLRARGAVDAEALKRGRRVFSRQKCASCHPPPAYTSPKSYDVGLRDEAGGTHFNPPSLRGVSQAGPYFHDGCARTLEEVFTRHRHQLSGKLSEQELRDLLHFLASL